MDPIQERGLTKDLFLHRRKQRLETAPRLREICARCVQPSFMCYCESLKRFDPKMSFIILIHPIEMKRRIATGRMSHLCLERSELLMGHDYSQNKRVNALIADSTRQSVILYPGRTSVNLSSLSVQERCDTFASDRDLTVFVIDGTWNTARQMLSRSANLKTLPRICFTPPGPSNFRVRKQPAEGCYSTIEAVHHTIELLGPTRGFDVEAGTHHELLRAFNRMVERQLQFVPERLNLRREVLRTERVQS